MEIQEDEIRKMIREETSKLLREYNGPGKVIYNNVMDSLQDAEEIWGVGDDTQDYITLLEAIRDEIEQRIEIAKDHIS